MNRPAVFDESVSKSLVEIRKLARLTVKKSGRYAQLEVSQLSAAAADMQEVNELIVLEDSLAQTEHHLADPSHAIVVGLPQHDSPFAELCGDLLAQRVVAVYPAIA